jgi:diguanylate cyclase (GGDEF)-like protein
MKKKKKAPAKSPAKKGGASKKSRPSRQDSGILSLVYPEHLRESSVVQELRAKVERLKVFDSLGRTLTSSLDLEEILRLVIDRFAHLVGSKKMGLIFTVSETNQFYFQYPTIPAKFHNLFSEGRGILGRAIDSGKAQLILNPMMRPEFDQEVDSMIFQLPGSMITLPILSKGRVLGLLVFVTAQDERPLTDEKKNLLESFSDYIAIAVENALSHRKVQDLTITDDLTKLYNSRYLPVVLEREISRSRRYREELSLVFLDLDDFKQVNDRYGHMAGSQLLTEFGNFLYDRVRSSDVGIRYGGDEFVLILPKTSKRAALKFVQRTIEELRAHSFLHRQGLNLKCTASFGIASFPEDGETVDQIIAAADKAMYEVKRSSKDGVFATPSRAKL